MSVNQVALWYLVASVCFILALKGLSHPETARRGNYFGMVGMAIAVFTTLSIPGVSWDRIGLILLLMLVGGTIGGFVARRVQMTQMPELVAAMHSLVGLAAVLIAFAVVSNPLAFNIPVPLPHGNRVELFIGTFVGAMTFSGSVIAFGKLQGLIKRSFRFRGQNIVNLLILTGTLVAGAVVVLYAPGPVTLLFALALVLGVTMTLPIGGADMPVVISLYNALTGLAVAFEGFVLNNAAMIIAGTVVGSAGTLLTQLMAKAMNRSLANVLFSGFGETAAAGATGPAGTLKAIETADAAVMLGFSEKVIVVPGYGMAVAQAQHKVWELCQALIARGVTVKFAIHPVAGRMPGHMNVLLAEAGVPYDLIYDEAEINSEFETADVALIIGANDVVNPVARTDKSSPIYGMPILNADKAKNVIVIKRGQGAGFSGIENALFYLDHARMLYGDGQAKAAELVQAVKAL